jgi:hypothetical protein
MMKELKRIRGLLGSRTEVHGGENGAIDRVAAITLERLGMSFPLKESVQL